MLILAGAAVSIGLNGDSIFDKANEAKASWNKKANEEDSTVNSYLANIDQYTGGEYEPITGILDLNYDLLADEGNTYKKVTVSIDGLVETTEQQILQAIADSWGDGDSADDVKSYIEDDVENEYYNNYAQGLRDYVLIEGLSYYTKGLDDYVQTEGKSSLYEPISMTVKLNGTVIPSHREFFLATQNGTYNVTVRSESNKVGTIDIVIDETKIGTTKEQSGINEELFGVPANYDYTDSSSKYARIPTGYYVGTSSTINTIANGLVITSSIDEDGHSTGDEYVWIPVDDINNMVMCKSRTDSSECDIDFVEGVLKCKNSNHSATATQLCGRLYEHNVNYANPTQTEIGDNIYSGMMATSKTGQIWNTHGYREPDIVSNYDKSDATSGNNYMEKAGIVDKTIETFSSQLSNDFYEMAKSVAEYKGFWIARYETGSAGESKKAQAVANGNENRNMWYGLYRISRNIDSTNKIAKTMIWGSQYDQAIKFIGTQAQIGHSDRQLGTNINPSAYAPLDKMSNIYDLEANLWEWTAEAYDSEGRIDRGNDCDNVARGQLYPASDSSAPTSCHPNVAYMDDTSRATLYVTL